jgi:general secretion pathway protein F
MRFAYELLNGDGRLERGALDAATESEARRQLQRQGSTVLEVRPQAASLRRRRAFSDSELLLAFSELATLLRSGLGIAESVASIAAAHEHDSRHEILEKLGRMIAQGKPFAESLRLSGAQLPEYFFQLAAAGEMTGRLAESLEEAAEQFAYQQEVRSEIRNALIYPAVLVCTGILAVGLMFTFVVPKFAGMLKDAEQLPWLAWAVLSGGTFMADNLLLVLLALAALGGALSYPLRRPEIRERLLDALGRWPVFGPWLTESDTARWAKLLSALLGQGVPMLDALALANRGVALASVRSRLDAAARAVKGGLSLSKALEEQSALSTTAYNLLRTGERAGKLPEMLRSLAELYGKSGRNRMKRVLLLVEPLSILLIGGAIGTIVIGIVLAITSVSDIPL